MSLDKRLSQNVRRFCQEKSASIRVQIGFRSQKLGCFRCNSRKPRYQKGQMSRKRGDKIEEEQPHGLHLAKANQKKWGNNEVLDFAT